MIILLFFADRMESLTPPPDPVDKKLKITHVECHPECLVIVFQAQYNAGCELDYYILQNEIQRVFKVKDDVCVGGSCLVEDTDGEWHRGRVLRKKGNICEAFLIDTGHVWLLRKHILLLLVMNCFSCLQRWFWVFLQAYFLLEKDGVQKPLTIFHLW